MNAKRTWEFRFRDMRCLGLVVGFVAAAVLVLGTTASARVPARSLTWRLANSSTALCPLRKVEGRTFPALNWSQAAPPAALTSTLGVLRQPSNDQDFDRRSFNRFDEATVRVYARFIHVINEPQHVQIILIPALVCDAGTNTPRSGQMETDLLMQIRGPKFTDQQPPAISVGTATQIRDGQAEPGLDDSAVNHAWLQAVVVPDGVARVLLQWRLPHRRYSRLLTIHDNLGMAFPLGAETPAITTWYAADGHRIRRFVSPSVR